MKRSEVNELIHDAIVFLEEMNFKLPLWAKWSPSDWKGRELDCASIRRSALGWDITDFGSGDFERLGLLLFTVRNADPAGGAAAKLYAEKIMVVREGQVTPMHFHWLKTEDIINRGGGDLLMTLYRASDSDDGSFSDKPFPVSIDGIEHVCKPGETLRLKPGQSVTLTPRLYHSFKAAGAKTLVGEVSSANDDATDNRFHTPCGRFPLIDEDCAPEFLLCTEVLR